MNSFVLMILSSFLSVLQPEESGRGFTAEGGNGITSSTCRQSETDFTLMGCDLTEVKEAQTSASPQTAEISLHKKMCEMDKTEVKKGVIYRREYSVS